MVLNVADGVLGRSLDGHLDIERTLREVTLHQIVQRAVKDLAKLEQLVHLRVGLLRLPLGYRLAGDSHHHGQLFLGHATRGTQML